MSKHKVLLISGVCFFIFLPAFVFLKFGANPLNLILVSVVTSIGFIIYTSKEKEVLARKNIDVTNGSEVGNKIAKILGIVLVVVLVIPTILKMAGAF